VSCAVVGVARGGFAGDREGDESMSETNCSKCGGEMAEGTAGVSALRIWFRPENWSSKHVSFKLTSAHADVVKAMACAQCGYVDLYVDPNYLKKFIS